MPGFVDISGDALFPLLIRNDKTEAGGVFSDPRGDRALAEGLEVGLVQGQVHGGSELVLGVPGEGRTSCGGFPSGLLNPPREGCLLNEVGAVGGENGKPEARLGGGPEQLVKIWKSILS